MQLFNQMIRFFEMDWQFLTMKSRLSFSERLTSILNSNLHILSSFIKTQNKVTLLGKILQYDQRYSPKLFLSACFELYIATEKGSLLSDKPTIVDIGANIGQFMFATKLFYPNSRVICFEPSPATYVHLKENCKQFSNLKPNNLALGNKKGRLHFYQHKSFSVWSSLVEPEDTENYQQISTPVSTGDIELRNIPKIDLLKIDVEGFELETIKGLDQTLNKTQFLLIELSIQRSFIENKSEEVLSVILNKGFKIYSIGRIFDSGPGTSQSAVDMLFINTRIKNQKI
jgi:FkbM family methyltransferase